MTISAAIAQESQGVAVYLHVIESISVRDRSADRLNDSGTLYERHLITNFAAFQGLVILSLWRFYERFTQDLLDKQNME